MERAEGVEIELDEVVAPEELTGKDELDEDDEMDLDARELSEGS